MDKQAFLSELRSRLSGLPEAELKRWEEYYEEILADSMEDGLSEAEAVAALGSPEDLAAQILMDTPLPQLVRAKVSSRRKLSGWEVVLLVLGSPIWVPLLLTALILLLVLYLLLWILVLVVYIVELALILTVPISIASAAMAMRNRSPVTALFFLGSAVAGAGLAILGFFASKRATWGATKLSKLLLKKIKTRLIGEGERHE